MYFPLGGITTRKKLIQKLKDSNIYINTSIHLDIYDTNNIEIIEEFLFLLLITKLYKINKKIFYLFEDTEIYLEISNN